MIFTSSRPTMSRTDEVESEIEEIIATTLRIDRSEFDDETEFGPDGLDVDSLGIVEMAETMDMELGVGIPDEDLEELETVGDVKAYVVERYD